MSLKIYNIKEEIVNDEAKLEEWIDSWIETDCEDIEKMNGIKLNDSQKAYLKEQAIKQLNTWLFKTGENKTGNAPLYNSCNVTAYTRLITDEQTVSCCGGDITRPPMATQPVRGENGEVEATGCAPIFSELRGEDSSNTAEEVKNRLAWAMFKCKSDEESADMSPEEWNNYKQNWENVRNMTAADFRELLKPENQSKREEFEQTSQMSVGQIVQYIDIVESVIGKGKFDSDDWKIDAEQFYIIGQKVNDTYDDEKRLIGKTRADVPEKRQELLKFLEEKGWLYEQFR